MTEDDVKIICNRQAPTQGFDPALILAICEQESNYNDCSSRMENKFEHTYTLKEGLATTSAVLLATSYGLMQMMGQSLLEAGYFQWFISWYNSNHLDQLNDPRSQMTICKGIDEYMIHAEWQIEWGLKHLAKKKVLAGGDTRKMLQFWNGGGNPNYADEVLARMKEQTT